MAKKIDWLDNFAERYAKDMKKTASKISKEDLTLIVDRESIKGARLGEVIKFQGKLYKVADLDFEDEKGPGALLTETEPTSYGPVDETDPMSVSMGAPAAQFEGGQNAQEYARTNPGDIYHYEVPETFEQAAAETAQQIEKERAFDRSTVPGHYTAPKNMGGAPIATEPTVTEPMVTETPESPVDETIPTDVPVETTELPVEEPTDVVEETVVETEEVPVEEPTEEVEIPESEEVEEVEETETEEEEKVPTVARHNRILRRIMASK